MNPVAKGLVLTGIVLVCAGVFWQFGAKVLPLGRLPGDIVVEKPNFRFYFPVATSILLSVALSLLAYLFRSIK